jgi:uncharacterized protein CbrC (UPF0167 family)
MNDWIRLLVKYKGTCSACGKEISAGQYALWSKSSKAIKHSECKASNRQQTTTAVAEVDCFICRRPVTDNNYGFEAGDYGRRAILQASICNRCLEDKNAYQNYQGAFLEKVHRVAKVKI